MNSLTVASKLLYKGNKSPVTIIFFVTSNCNAKCNFCFYWQNLNKNKQELNLQQIEKISKSLNIYNLNLTGGEPFLRNDFVDIANLFYKNSKIKNLVIPTNGLLTNKIYNDVKSILNLCKDVNLFLSISIDNLYDKHDKIRNVKGAFNKAMKTYKKLRELKNKNLSIGFNVTVSRDNYNDLNEIYQYLRKLNPDNISPLLVRGNPKNPETKLIDINKYKEFTDLIKKDLEKGVYGYKANLSLINKRDIIAREISITIAKNKKQVLPCYAGSIIAVINEVGDVYPCELYDKKLGSLKDYNYDFNNLWNSDNAVKLRRKIRKSDCFCTHECFLNLNLLFNIKGFTSIIFGKNLYNKNAYNISK